MTYKRNPQYSQRVKSQEMREEEIYKKTRAIRNIRTLVNERKHGITISKVPESVKNVVDRLVL